MDGQANAVSDLERAEHKGFSAGLGAKRVIPYLDNGDGTYSDMAFQGFNIPEYDEVDLTYTGTNPTTIVFKRASITLATLTLTYDGNDNPLTIVKS